MQNITITGKVVEGAQKGRLMGFPTANIVLSHQYDTLKNGVYVAEISIGQEHFKGVANIGVHPTVGDAPEKLLEVHIFDFERDIYGNILTVTLKDFIRSERKFSSLNELIEQIGSDKNKVKLLFNK